MSYIFNKADVFAFAAAIGGSITEKGGELHFRYCPYCKGGDHKDKDTFAVNAETGAFNCMRASCGQQGHFVELCRDFNYPLNFGDQPQRKYRKLVQRPIQVRDKAIEFLKSRGISADICKAFNITTQAAHDNIVVFPFYDEQGIMQTAKYRKADFVKGRDKCKEWFEADTKPILFGMRQCIGFERLILCEGQVDSLSIIEAGLINAVSVPNGANGFTWVEHCFEWVNKFEEIVIFGDCENGKITLVDEFVKRFPKKRTLIVRQADYLGEKDANDILRKYGKDAVRKAVENAEPRKVKAVKSLSDVRMVDLEAMPKIQTGLKGLDRVIGGMYFGTVTLLTGKRGEGKSTLASCIFKAALEQGYSCFAYSGELPDFHFKAWLDRQIAGDCVKEDKNEWGDPLYSIDDSILAQINDWYCDRAFIYDNAAVSEKLTEGNAVEEQLTLLNAMQIAVCQYGIKFVLVDNLMTAMNANPSEDLYRAQSHFANTLKQLAQRLDIAVLLVAHPRKEAKGTELNNDSVSGTADITNAVDCVLTYQKDPEMQNNSKIGVTKNRLTGRVAYGDKSIPTYYDPKSKRIYSSDAERREISKCFENAAEQSAIEPVF